MGWPDAFALVGVNVVMFAGVGLWLWVDRRRDRDGH
jgi:uncharacterized iron-regulated membrane protein